MVSVSVAAVLGSLIVTPANGCTGASDVVLCPATVPLMVGAPAGSVLITVVLLLTVGVALALLRSLSVNVVVVLEPGAPAFGVKTSASSSLVMVTAAQRAGGATIAQRDGQRIGGPRIGVADSDPRKPVHRHRSL